jgi:hypothetical protein
MQKWRVTSVYVAIRPRQETFKLHILHTLKPVTGNLQVFMYFNNYSADAKKKLIEIIVTCNLLYGKEESHALFWFLQIFPASLSNQITWIFFKIGSTNNFIFD